MSIAREIYNKFLSHLSDSRNIYCAANIIVETAAKYNHTIKKVEVKFKRDKIVMVDYDFEDLSHIRIIKDVGRRVIPTSYEFSGPHGGVFKHLYL